MIAVYPGSFDPLTVGHMEIIRRASHLFDRVLVCVLVNPLKQPLFRADQRVRMIEDSVRGLPNVSALASDSPLLDVVRQQRADVILRGLRGDADYSAEKPVADAFLKLWGIETLFMQCDPALGYISSSLVREMKQFHIGLDPVVPAPILDQVSAERSK